MILVTLYIVTEAQAQDVSFKLGVKSSLFLAFLF